MVMRYALSAERSRAKHFCEFKAERSLRFCGDSDYVKMCCTGRDIGLVMLVLT